MMFIAPVQDLDLYRAPPAGQGTRGRGPRRALTGLSMVVTRKRSCSASETTTTPHGAKIRKQDEGGGTPATTITTRTSTRGVVGSGTGPSTPTRRTRRVTDSIAESVAASPRTTRLRLTRRSGIGTTDESASNSDEGGKYVDFSSSSDSSVSQSSKVKVGRSSAPRTPAKERNEISNDKGAKGVDSSVSQTSKVKESGNVGKGTPGKGKNKSANDKTPDNADPSLTSIFQQNKLVLRLKNIGTVLPQSPRPRRVSGGDKDLNGTPLTPVRRSRRLSGSGVEEGADKETPSKKSFTIARILGMEEKSEEMSKASLPVIEEDAEGIESKCSPNKDTKKALVLEEDEEKVDVEAESNRKHTRNKDTKKALVLAEQEKDVKAESNRKHSPNKDAKKALVLSEQQEQVDEAESDNEDLTDAKNVSSDSSSLTQEVENKTRSVVVDEPAAVDERDGKDGPGKKEAQEKTSSEAMQTQDISSTTNVTGTERNTNTAMETEGDQDRMEVTESNKSEESKHETAKVPESDNIEEDTESPVTSEESKTVNGIDTATEMCNRNGNSVKVNGVTGLVSAVMTDKKRNKAILPELEKKIDQLRSIPKGRSVSGKWWKAEKQRFRSMNKDATGKKSWSRKMQVKQWRGDVLAKSAAIEAEKLKKKEDLKERQRINKERREENAKKSEVVQVIKDPRKIKKMKRKQLKYLATRDTTNMKAV